MKGYFSRIARQSGLRIAGQGTPAAGGTARPSAASPSPLERDEVVMLPPMSGEVSSHVSARRTPEEGSAIGGSQEIRLHDSPTEQAAPGSSAEPSAEQGAKVIRTPNEIDPRADSATSSTQLGESGITTEHGVIKTLEQRLDAGPHGSRKPAREGDAKDFFSQTAEIIGGRQLERSETQSVVVREIQEWAASGWSDAAMPDAAPDDTGDVGGLRSKEIDTGPGVIRVVDERTTKQLWEAHDIRSGSSIEESTFDLSIGSVTVVIEGDSAAPNLSPQPARQREQAVERRTPPRLRRSYL